MKKVAFVLFVFGMVSGASAADVNPEYYTSANSSVALNELTPAAGGYVAPRPLLADNAEYYSSANSAPSIAQLSPAAGGHIAERPKLASNPEYYGLDN